MHPVKPAVVTWKDSQTCLNEWARLFSNKTLFTHTPRGLDSVRGPNHSDLTLSEPLSVLAKPTLTGCLSHQVRFEELTSASTASVLLSNP